MEDSGIAAAEDKLNSRWNACGFSFQMGDATRWNARKADIGWPPQNGGLLSGLPSSPSSDTGEFTGRSWRSGICIREIYAVSMRKVVGSLGLRDKF